ncbi:hypothetical protein [Candidatus Ichthyocystis hellenicum]|uniref:hypothetical protein n=1 Tax=Candidatus Ichthyocystis hellenicum TaxID=1561003 RepID=UPI000B8812D8|nr:hypothetical protein [Candidatus Ichthyocystis hellenicum]
MDRTCGNPPGGVNCRLYDDDNEISTTESRSSRKNSTTALLDLDADSQHTDFVDCGSSCSSSSFVASAVCPRDDITLPSLVSVGETSGANNEELLNENSPQGGTCEKIVSTLTWLVFCFSAISTVVGISCVGCQNFDGFYQKLCENNSSSENLDPDSKFCNTLMKRDTSCKDLKSFLSNDKFDFLDPSVSIPLTLVGSLSAMLSLSTLLIHSSFMSMGKSAECAANPDENTDAENHRQIDNRETEGEEVTNDNLGEILVEAEAPHSHNEDNTQRYLDNA